MSDEHTANTPIALPEVLQEELDSFDTGQTPVDLTKPAEQRLREVHARIRALQPERSALCLSGGGIRSATFALGAVQALAKAGLLTKFDYLSTVSGGGYLGSMLSAWIHSHPRKLEGVADDLAGRDADGQPAPEVRPLRHLREFSNYLSPKLGLFSADGWTLVATALRNLLLNWTVIVLLLAGLLTLPWLGLLGVLGKPLTGQLDVLLRVAFVCFAAATAYPGLDLPSLGNLRARQPWFLLGWMAPMLTGVLCLVAWWAGYSNTVGGSLEWLLSRQGQWAVVCFLVKFSVVGAALSLVIVVPGQIVSGVFRKRATFRYWRNVGLTILAAVAVVGLPGAALLWWLAAEFFPNPGQHAVQYITLAPVVLLVGFFLLNSLFVGVTSWISEADDREWWARAAGWIGAVTVGWLAVHGLVFWVPQWIEIYLGPALQASVAASGGILGFIAAKLGASERTPALLADRPATRKNLLLTGAAVAFFALLSCGISLIVDTLIFHKTMLPMVLAKDEQENVWRRMKMRAALDPAVFTLALPALAPLTEQGVFAQTRLEHHERTMPDLGELGSDPPAAPVLTVLAQEEKESAWQQMRAQQATPEAAFCMLTLPLSAPTPLVEESIFAPTRLDIQRRTLPGFAEARIEIFTPWRAVLENRRTFARFGLLLESLPEGVKAPPPDDWFFHLLRWLAKDGDAFWTFAAGLGLTLGALLGGGFVMGCFVNVNRFSLHATYRNRLVRAYLGAARAFVGEKGQTLRQPHRFTGFDPDDDIRLAEMEHPRPLHVVNMTLNLVGGDELAWQERRATSFTATRLHCGCARGYRPSTGFSGGLHLGTALAISGAAANPNQGYNSSPILTFLMTLFNVRLGWWLGNPARPGSRAWRRPGPRHAAVPLFTEALGLTNEKRAFLNLSDGGHFENLAIYEMLRRRCRYIVVIDAEHDPRHAFDGLGGIIRKARVDMGIPILFPRHKPEAMKKTRTAPGSHFALGEIDYQKADPTAENGLLLYLKPVLLGGEPADVQHYAKISRDFPHESTGDQFFSESQFESYRALGMHEMTKVLESPTKPPTTIAELCTGLNALDLPAA